MKTPLAVAILLAAAALPAQQLMHHDGTNEDHSRGFGPSNHQLTVLQRFPWNQCCGRTRLCCVELTLHDVNPATTESAYLEVRRNDPSNLAFPLGAPDMSASGLIHLQPVVLNFTTNVQKFSFVLNNGGPAACIDLPAIHAGPGGDFYVGIRFRPQPNWPGFDGVSCMFSGRTTVPPQVGEQFNPLFKPMYAPTAPGLGWSHNVTTGVTSIHPQDLSWAIGVGLSEDVCQPFASNAGSFTGAGGTGNNPNYGYAGIWPNAPDLIGWRVRTMAPPSSMSVLILGPNLGAPQDLSFFGFSGLLCVEPWIQLVHVTSSDPACTSVSSARFGPFTNPAPGSWFCVGAQGFTLDSQNPGALYVSTACTTVL
ncbi:MAG: hypothetical protein IT457_19335 [Planctomycetes bacterium]|nr:hypothetical protein [Planctomycetota bacterium]